MSSSPGVHRHASPADSLESRQSRFTYRHLAQLASSQPTCPLRVVSHVDLDCFYAQCESVRLKLDKDQPLAVQQWQGLIAVNYAARKFGIGRMCTVTEAKKLCPDLIAQHVATWREGDEQWAYHEDAAAQIASHKVSLDPYRLESRKILACIKAHLPSNMQKVEKAGIDEVFLDLSAQVHSVLLQRYPELAAPPPNGDATAHLPMPPTSVLDWAADALVDLDDADAEKDDPDWDDVAILIGSEIVREVRAAVKEQLNYTCSGGVAVNKMLSKLGSGYKKPNQQTVVRNRAIQPFLAGFKLTKIRNLGGKLGTQVVDTFMTDSIQELLSIPIEQLKLKLGDDTGTWIYNTIRGVDTSEVNSRTQIKSMLSAKSFRPDITTFEHAVKWLRIFVADIFSRLVEEGVLENKRRPKSINLYHRHGSVTRSRQSAIPVGRPIDEQTLFDLAKALLSQIVLEGQVWPCHNLSLSVAGFEDGITGNMGIGGFLVKGKEAEALKAGAREPADGDASQQPAPKRRQIQNQGIHRFFTKDEPRQATSSLLGSNDDTASYKLGGREPPNVSPMDTFNHNQDASNAVMADVIQPVAQHIQEPSAELICDRCLARFTRMEFQSHQDWHFAKDLQDEEGRGSPAFANRSSAPHTASAASSRRNGLRGAATTARRPGRPSKAASEQKNKLKFG